MKHIISLLKPTFWIILITLHHCDKIPTIEPTPIQQNVIFAGFGEYYDDGRLGNQMLDMFFLSCYCHIFNLNCFIDHHWLGQDFFQPNSFLQSYQDYPHEMITLDRLKQLSTQNQLPDLSTKASVEYNLAILKQLSSPHQPILAQSTLKNGIVAGHFFVPSYIYNNSFSQNIFSTIFNIKPEIHNHLKKSFQAIQEDKNGDLWIGIHYRGGDLFKVQKHWSSVFYVIPLEWYLNAVQYVLKQFPDRSILLYIASDEPEIPHQFFQKHFKTNPKIQIISANDLSADTIKPIQNQLKKETFSLIDFWALANLADIMIVSPSTFSFAASLYNALHHDPHQLPDKTKRFFRPNPEKELFTNFNPWLEHPQVFNKRKKIFTDKKDLINDDKPLKTEDTLDKEEALDSIGINTPS